MTWGEVETPVGEYFWAHTPNLTDADVSCQVNNTLKMKWMTVMQCRICVYNRYRQHRTATATQKQKI